MSVSSPRRVVITGMGVVSPIGSDLESLWENLQANKSGISKLQNLPTQSLPIQAGGEVADFTGAIEDYGELDKQLKRSIKKAAKVMCREIEMGVAVSQKALAHSELPAERDANRCGCLFGCDYILTRPEEFADGVTNCVTESSESKFDVADWPIHGLGKVNPLWLLKYLPNMPNSHVSIYNDFRGPNNSLTVREASMNLAVAEAASIIARDAADVMLVGATGTRLHPLRTSHVSLIEQLATNREEPQEMARPFDQSSDGMVLGEGAGALVLESLESAQARGAKIWGEIIGQGSSMVGPGAGSDFICHAVTGALDAAITSAGEQLGDNWHLHASGLGVPKLDANEASAVSAVLKKHNCTSTPVAVAKSFYGNLGAGAGAIELISSILAMQNGNLFDVLNLSEPQAEVQFELATRSTPAGKAVVHGSYTQQGQASAIAIAAA